MSYCQLLSYLFDMNVDRRWFLSRLNIVTYYHFLFIITSYSKIKTKGMIELAQAIKDEDDREIKEAAIAAASRVSAAISNMSADTLMSSHA